jgi:hypothetical protein
MREFMPVTRSLDVEKSTWSAIIRSRRETGPRLEFEDKLALVIIFHRGSYRNGGVFGATTDRPGIQVGVRAEMEDLIFSAKKVESTC